ncbi:putative RNA methyltransferase [Bacillus sp. JJ722]|uniref:putative RNA methyltransferase n=1 Tax=Bacillus sp. JJ722 TaxID=3122973 RepID=UPI002FFDEFC9
MSKKTKKMESALLVSDFESIFKCPICESPMKVIDFKSLSCSNNHTFDFAKQGYINLLTHQMKTKYGKALFEARRKLIVEGEFFQPLSAAITEIIGKQVNAFAGDISILDTGCGEGSHLINVCDRLRTKFNQKVTGVGIDIAKEGLFEAAKHYSNTIWCVSDLANTRPC